MLPSNPICAVCDYGTSATYRDLPSDEQLRNGVVPLDSLPAAWWNCMWNMTNHSINQARSAVGVLIEEINTVLTQAGVCACDICVDQLYKAIDNISQTVGNAVRAGAVKSSSCCGQVSIDNNGIMTANGLGNAACLTTTAQNAIGAINELKSTYDTCWSNNTTALGGKAPTSHASSANTYGVGSAANYGHLKISDTYTSVLTACSGVAASQQAVTCVYCYAAGIAAAALGLGNTNGCALGTASAGTATTAARSDHVHPKPSRADLGLGTAADCAATAFLGASGCAVDSAKLTGKAPSALCVACAGQAYCVMDYCSNATPLYIGYACTGLTCAQITHLAAFSTNYTSGKTVIKDVCKGNVQSWLGLGTAAYCAATAFLKASACATDSAKLNGYGSSTDNTVNCIVRRDNSGYIYVTKIVTPRIDSVKPTGSATSSGTKLWAWASANTAIDVACVSGNGLLYQRAWSSDANSAFKIPFMNLTGAQTVGTCSDLTYFAVDSGSTFTYNPSTNTLTAGTFSGCATDSAKLTGCTPATLCVCKAGCASQSANACYASCANTSFCTKMANTQGVYVITRDVAVCVSLDLAGYCYARFRLLQSSDLGYANNTISVYICAEAGYMSEGQAFVPTGDYDGFEFQVLGQASGLCACDSAAAYIGMTCSQDRPHNSRWVGGWERTWRPSNGSCCQIMGYMGPQIYVQCSCLIPSSDGWVLQCLLNYASCFPPYACRNRTEVKHMAGLFYRTGMASSYKPTVLIRALYGYN